MHVVACAVQARRAGRQQRFALDLASIKAVSHPGSSSNTFSEESIGSGWLALQGGFGSNMSLEKEYLRLTSVPKSEDVRPPEVREMQQLLRTSPHNMCGASRQLQQSRPFEAAATMRFISPCVLFKGGGIVANYARSRACCAMIYTYLRQRLGAHVLLQRLSTILSIM